MAVGEHDVDVVELQALERCVHALNKVLARESAAVPGGSAVAKEQLGNDHDLLPVISRSISAKGEHV